jgi:hypothetical protein
LPALELKRTRIQLCETHCSVFGATVGDVSHLVHFGEDEVEFDFFVCEVFGGRWMSATRFG